jgi:TolB-like protein/DNA-binding winged helix-turn-helix (wHTH) protein
MPNAESRIRFGPFEFDANSGELRRDGRRVRLQRQPSRLLELLTARPGEVITRDEIRQALWGNDTYVDFERSLNFCVARLRAALGDNATSPAFVETVPTRGYRFIAAVERAAPEAFRLKAEATGTRAEATGTKADATNSTEWLPPSGGRSPAGRRALAGVAGALVLVAAALGVRAWAPLTGGGAPKVVVVPFRNETGVPDLDRVAKGVSDATVVKLAESNGLRVIGNASGLTLSFRPADMKAMGEALGAQYLVLGQMKRDERQMRIVAHLIRVSDQTHVWATTIDRPSLDLPAQSEIADVIAKAVTARIRGFRL